MLVGAVLVPERAHDSELGEGRCAPEERDESLVFLLRQTVLGDERRGDLWVAGTRLDAHYFSPKREPMKREISLRFT